MILVESNGHAEMISGKAVKYLSGKHSVSGAVCLKLISFTGCGGYRVFPAVFVFRVLVDYLKLFPGKNKADRCFTLTVKLLLISRGAKMRSPASPRTPKTRVIIVSINQLAAPVR